MPVESSYPERREMESCGFSSGGTCSSLLCSFDLCCSLGVHTHPIHLALSHRYGRCGGQMWFPGKIGHGHAYSAAVMAGRPCAMAEHSAITADARAIGLVK